MGKHKYIETPEKMWELFIEYKNSVKDNPAKIQDYVGKDAEMVYREKEKPLTFEGFECYLFDNGIISDLSKYFANTDSKYSEYCAICSHIRKVIKNDQIQGGMIGIYNPSITQRLNGLTETITTTIKEQPLFGEK
jgi:hypothetical protein